MSKEGNLFRAIWVDKPRAAKKTISMGADVNARNVMDRTPLHEACIKNRPDIARMLLDAGAKVDIAGLPSDHEWDLLQAACIDGYTDIVRLLIEYGANMDMPDAAKQRPLHLACFNGHVPIVRLLIEKGADVNATADGGWTPLHAACSEFGYPNSAIPLLEHGANADIRDNDGLTPLHRLLQWSGENPAREEIIDWYREHHPEMVMEAYCVQTPPDPGLRV